MNKILPAFFAMLLFLSCKKSAVPAKTNPVVFSNILILGNSITFAPSTPSIGWNANWGMAATAPEKDYVHLLTAHFLQTNASASVQVKNIAAFEVNAVTYDFDTELKFYRDLKPDLLLIRIGENVPADFDLALFTKRYQALLAYMKIGNPDIKILAAGSFWLNHEGANAVLSGNSAYVSLSFLGNDFSNYALNMPNVSDGVKQHPNDKGMQAIAETIWAKIRTLN